MDNIRLDGLATGMDTRHVIERLMEVERRPIEQKEQDIAEIEQKREMWRNVRKDIKNIEDAFSPLQDETTFETMNTSSTSENIIATDAKPNAEVGNYNVEVYQVAQRHEAQSDSIEEIEDLEEDLFEKDVISEGTFDIGLNGDGDNGAEFTTVTIDEGDGVTLTFNGNDDDEEVEVELDELTLENLARELDDNIDNVNVRTRSVDDNYYLHLEGADYGRDLYLEDHEDDSILQEDLGIIDGNGDIEDENELQEAQYAYFNINGMEFKEYEGNSVEIDGVTIDVSGAEPDVDEESDDPFDNDPDPATITVERDLETTREAINNFIESYNQLKDHFEELGGEEAPLQGDSTLNMLDNRLRQAISNVVPDNNSEEDEGLVTANFGLEFDTDPERSGYLLTPEEDNFLDKNIGNKIEEKLTDEEGLEQLKTLFTREDDGIANRLENNTDLILRGESDLIGNRRDNLENERERIENRIERREERIARREERLWSEFTRMEQAIQEMHAMQEGMRNQISQLQAMGQQG